MPNELNTENTRLFNIDILILKSPLLQMMGEIKRLNIFEQNSSNFDQSGLFSTTIFGPVGTEMRNNQFGYIDVNIDVLHPLVFENLMSLKSIYKDIASGNKYAKFDKELKDLVLCQQDDKEADTGYEFLISNLNKIEFKNNDSNQRDFKIKFVKKYSTPEYYINKWLVLPAGLRDYVIDESGKPSEDAVNDIYRKLVTTVQILKNTSITKDNIKLLDNVRFKIQNILIDLYEYFKTLMDGKSKFIQSKFAKRAIANGTRNVITPCLPNLTDLDSEHIITSNHAICGIYQFVKGISPIALNKLHTNFISHILSPNTNKANLVNPKTMRTELVDIKTNKRDEWLSLEGLDNVLNKLGQEDIRVEPVKIDNYYMCLLYDTGDYIEVVFDTATLPDTYDKKYLRPITYAELIYISIYKIKDDYPGFLTRYPVAGLGGIYPTKLYVKTTIKSRTVNVKLPFEAEPIKMIEFPLLSSDFDASLKPSNSHISRLVADFDGDMCSLNIVYTDNSIKEINDMLNNKSYYLTPEGDITYSSKTEPLDYILGHMSDF